jgi:hypothetical protein
MEYFVVDVSRDGTYVSKMIVEEGKYRQVINIQANNFKQQAELLIVHMLKHRPNKLFIDNIGFGAGLLDSLKSEMSSCGLQLLEDATVIYG